MNITSSNAQDEKGIEVVHLLPSSPELDGMRRVSDGRSYSSDVRNTRKGYAREDPGTAQRIFSRQASGRAYVDKYMQVDRKMDGRGT